jgi:hypothetical protein
MHGRIWNDLLRSGLCISNPIRNYKVVRPNFLWLIDRMAHTSLKILVTLSMRKRPLQKIVSGYCLKISIGASKTFVTWYKDPWSYGLRNSSSRFLLSPSQSLPLNFAFLAPKQKHSTRKWLLQNTARHNVFFDICHSANVVACIV